MSSDVSSIRYVKKIKKIISVFPSCKYQARALNTYIIFVFPYFLMSGKRYGYVIMIYGDRVENDMLSFVNVLSVLF